jgi:hypothetical protein
MIPITSTASRRRRQDRGQTDSAIWRFRTILSKADHRRQTRRESQRPTPSKDAMLARHDEDRRRACLSPSSDLTYEGYDFALANAFAQKYELKQFLSRLPISPSKKARPAPSKANRVENHSSFQGYRSQISPLGFALDIDYDEYHDAPIEGIAISSGRDRLLRKRSKTSGKTRSSKKAYRRSLRSSKTSTMAKPRSTPSIAKESHSKASKTISFRRLSPG